ncbi:MAG: response regulator [Lachnospiraceae bacterium]|nr:response regulator [Lachnospiraceae bacterium]
MYKILIADDEGIVLDSMKLIVEKSFPGECEIRTAKTGRAVIETAEEFRPDIAFMDIQMPGINGIDAMKEIRGSNENVILIVMSAYDRFNYAKEAISLGVMEYINKPFTRDMIIDVMSRAMRKVDRAREKRAEGLKIREKMETVVPVIETGFIYAMLFQENFTEDVENYRLLLGMDNEFGYVGVIECGSERQGGKMTNTVGTGIKLQNEYNHIRDIVKEFFDPVFVGSLMANKIIIFVPVDKESIDYTERVDIINRGSEMNRKLHEKCDAYFRFGIGSVRPLSDAPDSYREALDALLMTSQGIAHVKDLPVGCRYDPDYPIDLEKKLFERLEAGDTVGTVDTAGAFCDWMEKTYPDNILSIKLKVLEFALWAEHQAYTSGGLTYHFTDRESYLPEIMGFLEMKEIRQWFLARVTDAAENIATKRDEESDDLVARTRKYVDERYPEDISLDEISRNNDVSPYYLSRLFKEETGETFMEYLTGHRIDKAKELMADSDMAMKDICLAVGYSDPNYFSRIFKKKTGMTPTDYRIAEGK